MSNGSDNLLEKKFTTLNNLVGWLVFAIALFVYYSTVEPTASFWDCSENLSIYYKLEVGHPPGEPFLQLLQHVVSLLSFGDVHKAAPLMNHAASTFSALAILFLFWTTTFFARKIVIRNGGLTDSNIYLILASGFVGAVSFIFADSMWFSAVEASVWAGSICFSSLMFWCSTKMARSEHSAERWVVFIFFLVGISIGVHMLCLLFIPAAVFLYYFRRYPDGIDSKWGNILLSRVTKNKKTQGVILAAVTGVFILGFVKTLIPYLIWFVYKFELLFVNSFGMPFNSGALAFGILVLGLILWGLNFSKKRNKPALNLAILSFGVFVIGYCSFMLLVVRANAVTPMNEDNPSDPVSLKDYLDRKQYGDWPVLYGPYYTAPQVNPIDEGPIYVKDEKTGKYIKSYELKMPDYDSRFKVLFPRMWDAGESHPHGYKSWGGTDVTKIAVYNQETQQTEQRDKPTYGDNIHYFLSYQVWFMYWRYFLWNFCGRQNDIQGEDPQDNLHGNWITGISFLDAMRAPAEGQPDELSKNKGKNGMYGLPFLLGVLGFIYLYRKDRRNALVVLTFFFFTGMAIILYLNQAPYQPRERDYSYVGSFYGFAICIGLGVMGLFDIISKRMKQGNPMPAIAVATLVSLVVPVLMANAEWDDHDRSKRTTTRDLAIDYLESCPPNAILFTNGDNDTFPLWYAQEVEGIRTDVRVCNLELLGMSWYVDQMNRKAYKSDRMPFSLTHDQYRDGTRDYTYFIEDKRLKGYVDLKELIDFVKSDNISDQYPVGQGEYVNYFPTKNFALKVDKDAVIKSGMLPKKLQDSIQPSIYWTMHGNVVYRSTLMVLDALAHNDWKRPFCFAVTTGTEAYMGMEKYFQLEGLVYRLTPVETNPSDMVEGTRVNTDVMYDNVMHKFKWGNMSSGEYLDENVRRMATDLRIQVGTLAEALIKENKQDSALKVLNVCMDSISEKSCPYDGPVVMLDYDYYQLKQYNKANELAKKMFDTFEQNLRYYHSLEPVNANYYSPQVEQASVLLERLQYFAETSGQADIAKGFKSRLDVLQKAGMLKGMQ